MKKLYTKSSKINGTGLYTKQEIIKGETIAYIHGEIVVFRNFTPSVSRKMLDWIGVGRYSWINTDQSLFRFINHSCEPNTAIVTKRKVIALSHINAEEEITMDYSLTEAEPGWSIERCSCGAKKCRRTITPIIGLAREIYLKNKKHIPENFRKIYESTVHRK